MRKSWYFALNKVLNVNVLSVLSALYAFCWLEGPHLVHRPNLTEMLLLTIS